MKVLVLALVLIGVAIAAPNKHLKFRHLTKPSLQKANPQHPSGRIVNGEIAEPHSIPYQVFIEFYRADGTGLYCSGTLISETVVLTAGNCGHDSTTARIILGAQKPLQNETEQVIVESDDIVVHEDFDIDLIVNDICLVRLKEPVELNDNIALAVLPTKDDVNTTYVDETGRVSGWGWLEGFGEQLSEDLRWIENKIITNEECSESFYHVPSTQICLSGENRKKTCNGDAGGPLVVNGTQVGIVSYGTLYCMEFTPSVSTRITSYLDWIEENSKPKN